MNMKDIFIQSNQNMRRYNNPCIGPTITINLNI